MINEEGHGCSLDPEFTPSTSSVQLICVPFTSVAPRPGGTIGGSDPFNSTVRSDRCLVAVVVIGPMLCVQCVVCWVCVVMMNHRIRLELPPREAAPTLPP